MSPSRCEARANDSAIAQDFRLRDVEVDYAVRDGAGIAYEVFGSGSVDLVFSGRFPIDLMWDLPQLAYFLDALGKVARVIAYDNRGYGASDPLPTTDGAAGTESAATDLLAVMDAVGCDRASLLNLYGATHVVFFAATYPERVRSLTYSRALADLVPGVARLFHGTAQEDGAGVGDDAGFAVRESACRP